MIRVVHPGSRIRTLTFYPYRIPDPGVAAGKKQSRKNYFENKRAAEKKKRYYHSIKKINDENHVRYLSRPFK
jgi:hypothetical protein